MTMDAQTMVKDGAARLFKDLCTDDRLHRAAQGEWLADAWRAVDDMGLPLALVDEAAGGFGVDPFEALEVLRLAGHSLLPLPLADTMLANRRLAEAGFMPRPGVTLQVPGLVAEPLALRRQGQGWQLSGVCRHVGWGRHAERLAVLARHEGRLYFADVPAGAWRCEPDQNLRGVACDTLHIALALGEEAVRPAPHPQATYAADDAALASLAIAGALERLLAQTVAYAGERSQFGKPLARFQVIQQHIAVLAGQACAAAAAADMAARALVHGGDTLPIAMAKSRAGEAAGLACSLAHQIHGAIGITAEHRLHFITRWLWSHRDAGGAEAYWNVQIGQRVAQAGGDALWPWLAGL